MEPAVLPRKDAALFAGLKVSTMEHEIRQGRFPRPRKVTGGRVGWLRREINEWAEALPVSDLLPGPGAAAPVTPHPTPARQGVPPAA